LKNRNILIEQLYPGMKDYEDHFYEVLPAFKDKRYLLIDGKPIFLVYQPLEIPDCHNFIELWQKLAIENGLNGIFFIANFDKPKKTENILNLGFDAINLNRIFEYAKSNKKPRTKLYDWIQKKIFKVPIHYLYKDVYPTFSGPEDEKVNIFPTIIPGWDHSPRSGKEGLVYHNSTPELFENHINQVLNRIINKPVERKIIFLKSWNEWAEGNYVEPDIKFGTKYLEAISKSILIQ